MLGWVSLVLLWGKPNILYHCQYKGIYAVGSLSKRSAQQNDQTAWLCLPCRPGILACQRWGPCAYSWQPWQRWGPCCCSWQLWQHWGLALAPGSIVWLLFVIFGVLQYPGWHQPSCISFLHVNCYCVTSWSFDCYCATEWNSKTYLKSVLPNVQSQLPSQIKNVTKSYQAIIYW